MGEGDDRESEVPHRTAVKGSTLQVVHRGSSEYKLLKSLGYGLLI